MPSKDARPLHHAEQKQNLSTGVAAAGKSLAGLFTIFMFADGILTIFPPPDLIRKTMAVGWPLWTGPLVGTSALIIALLFALPRTSVLGAILAVGYLGGAIATHLRVGEIGSSPQLICVVAGAAAWGALWLREPTLRDLLPLASRPKRP